MKQKVKKYVEDHWWAFGLQAVIGIIFGLVALFLPQPTVFEYGADHAAEQLPVLATVVAGALVLLGVIEIFRTLISVKTQKDWGLSLLIAVVSVGVGVAAYVGRDSGYAMLSFIIGSFLVLKGVFDLIVGFAVHDDSTDRIIWAASGIAGAVLGVAIVNYPNTGANQFIAVFGAYMLIFGVANLIYAAHSRAIWNELKEEKMSRKEAAKRIKTKRAAKKASKK